MDNTFPKLLLIDRDGVILQHVEPYILKEEDMRFVDGADEALKQISNLGIKIAVISNQSPISRGYITSEFVDSTNEKIREVVGIDCNNLRFYYCPHQDSDKCECRKPKPQLLLKAMKDFEIRPEYTWMIGDADTDMLAGINAGVSKCIHLMSGRQNTKSVFADTERLNLQEVVFTDLIKK